MPWGVKATQLWLLDSLISNDISLQLPDWEGAEGRESTHATTTDAATTTTIPLYHHHTTTPPTCPPDVRASPRCTSHYHYCMQHMTLITFR